MSPKKRDRKSSRDKKSQFQQTWGVIRPYFQQYRKRLYFVIFLSLIASAFEPSIAVLIKPVFNAVVEKPEESLPWLWTVPLGIIVIFSLRGGFVFFAKYSLEKLVLRVVRDIQTALYEHFMFLSLAHYERTTTGEMMSRTINDTAYMNRIIPMTVDTISQTFQLFALIGVCFYMEPWLSILAMVVFPAALLPTQWVGTGMRRYTKKGLREVAVINSQMQETYSGTKVVKAFAMETREVDRYRETMYRLLGIQYKYAKVKNLISPLIGAMGAIGIAPIVYYALWRVCGEIRTNPGIVGTLSAYVGAVALMYNPLRKLGETFGHLSSAYGAAERIRQTFEQQTTVTEAPDAVELGPMTRGIGYDHVSFKYQDEWVLRDFNLEANKGELIALVGVSGSGKTTVVNLLPRFYDATEGAVLIDGNDIRRATLKSLRLQIGVVTQETFLFNDTAANNILYGSEGKSREEVVAAAKAANAHDFILKLPNGYDTVIGERGVRLSGGERQRIAIARALLKDPPILLLDEATSALDTAAEREVQKALDLLMKNRTTIAIAHRLSTIRHADKIIVIKKGRVAEQGTHVELMARDGEYKRLYEMQFFLGEHATDHYGDRDDGAEAAKN
jgi:subfamily B ATP-binding cassette protein MsbA